MVIDFLNSKKDNDRVSEIKSFFVNEIENSMKDDLKNNNPAGILDSERGVFNLFLQNGFLSNYEDYKTMINKTNRQEKLSHIKDYPEILFLKKNQSKLEEIKQLQASKKFSQCEATFHVVSKNTTCSDCKVFYLIHLLRNSILTIPNYKFFENFKINVVVYSCLPPNKLNWKHQGNMPLIVEYKHYGGAS